MTGGKMVRRAKKREWNMVTSLVTAAGVVLSVAGGGWATHEYLVGTFATKEAVIVAGAKADLLMDARIEALIKQRDQKKAKPRKTAEDLQDIKYLNEQIERLRNVQRGQTK